DPRPLFTLPPRADACDLIVTQRTQMAAHRNIHLAKKRDHLVARDSKLACQVVHSKLAQPNSSSRTSTSGSRLSARIPFAKPLSTIPITAVASRPAAEPKSAADGPATMVI